MSGYHWNLGQPLCWIICFLECIWFRDVKKIAVVCRFVAVAMLYSYQYIKGTHFENQFFFSWSNLYLIFKHWNQHNDIMDYENNRKWVKLRKPNSPLLMRTILPFEMHSHVWDGTPCWTCTDTFCHNLCLDTSASPHCAFCHVIGGNDFVKMIPHRNIRKV